MSITRRAKEINQIIRNAEAFPRIRDAEKEMIENEEAFLKRRDKKRKKREKQLKKQIHDLVGSPKLPPLKNNSPQKPPKDYFSGHVLNRDPNCSQYMPFNEVFFPKMFNTEANIYDPQTIDMLWMLGFQHDEYHKKHHQVEKHMKAEFK